MSHGALRIRQVTLWRDAGLSYTEIGRRLGVSRSRAYQLGIRSVSRRRANLRRIAANIHFLISVGQPE